MAKVNECLKLIGIICRGIVTGRTMIRRSRINVHSLMFFVYSSFAQFYTSILFSADNYNLPPVPWTQVLKSNIVGEKRFRKLILVLIPVCRAEFYIVLFPVWMWNVPSRGKEIQYQSWIYLWKIEDVSLLTSYCNGNGRGTSDGESDDPSRRPLRKLLNSENIPRNKTATRTTYL